MNIQVPFTLASVYPLGVWHSLGLRLRGLRQFQVFLASSPCATSASSSYFRGPWPVRSLSFLRFGSNPALKPTRILRAAYLVRYAFEPGHTNRKERNMKLTKLVLAVLTFSVIGTATAADLSCRTDSFGTTRCSDGTTYRTDSFGTTRDNQGNSWRTDSFGTTRGSDGSTYRTDSFGTTRDNQGNSWRTDSFGTTRSSDGTTCRTDSFGTTRCNR